MIPLVDLHRQFQLIESEIRLAIDQVLQHGQYILGPEVALFENSFASYCQAEHCVGVASGTDAITLALKAMDIGPGDEVIIPAFTFVATALGVTLAGATPVLVDVNSDDALINPSLVESAITQNTKAIIPVHLYGRCCEMNELLAIANQNNLRLIEDAAQAHGATFHGRKAGSMGHAAAFSFYPGKNLGAYGDGGAVVTSDSKLNEKLRLLRNWGSRIKYHHEEAGLNSRLDTIQAAILNVKLQYLDKWNSQRKEMASLYDLLLPEVIKPRNQPGIESVYHIYAIRVKERNAILEKLTSRGIGAGIHYPFPIHQLQAYQHLKVGETDFPESEQWASEELSLPLFAEISIQEVHQIATVLNKIIQECKV